MRLKDKVAIITGGGAGIGGATARLFAAEGARVVVADLNPETGASTAEAILRAGGEALFVETDVSDETSMSAMVARCIEAYGRIDILHNNAGGSTLNDGPVHRISNDEFWLKMRVDVFGTWLGCRLVIPQMIDQGGGAIVNSSSIHGLVGVKGRNAYSTAKGAIISMTRALAVEYAPHRIRVNCIAPGGTLTERVLGRLAGTPTVSASAGDHLLGFSEPIDIAQGVLYLASDEARTTTGHVLAVDSGFSIH